LAELSTRILDQLSEMVIVTDANIQDTGGPRILYVNRAMLELTGYQKNELIGKSPRIFQGKDTDKSTVQRIRKSIFAGKTVQETILNYTKDGTPYWTELNILPLRDKSGAVANYLSVQRDVTEERRVSEQLDKTRWQAELNEHHFASARRYAKIGVFDYSIDDDLQVWSDELIEMTGLGETLFPSPGETFISGIDKEDRAEFDRLFGRAIEHGEGYSITVRFHRPDGRMIHMQIIAEVRNIDGSNRIIGIARDCTEEIEAVKLLKQEEERFRVIAAALSDILWDYDIENEKFWVSPEWEKKLGLDLNVAELNPRHWLDYIEEEDRASARKSLRAALNSEQALWQFTCRMRDSDGAHVDIEINAALQRRDNGRVHRILGNVRNVTIERLQRDGFTRSRALEAVGKMTGGIAHDFNNLLMVIQGSAEMLEMSGLSEEDRDSLDLITQATQSAANLTARLLSFSGQSRLKTTQVDLNEMLSELQPLLRSAMTSAVELKVAVTEDIWTIQVDAGALEQAIINLAVNARDAMPDGGTFEITCENYGVSEKPVGQLYDLPPGDYVCICLKDSGVGMSEKVLARAFEPFFSTKDVGKGTGLGLSSVYGFARQSRGGVYISSQPGQGCTVRLCLPSSETRQNDTRTAPNVKAAPKRRGVKVLVVEDQPELRRLVDRVLRRLGFDVTTAPDGETALTLLEAGEKFEVLFTDVIMPGGIGGVQLAKAVSELAPRTRVLFTTGYTADAFETLEADRGDGIRILRKPYKTDDLIQAFNEFI
jgi:PAS domain S-box-containing protein